MHPALSTPSPASSPAPIADLLGTIVVLDILLIAPMLIATLTALVIMANHLCLHLCTRHRRPRRPPRRPTASRGSARIVALDDHRDPADSRHGATHAQTDPLPDEPA